MNEQYRVGIYTRISIEDSRGAIDESQSVENQRTLLESYAHQMGWPVEHVYTDDGWSGSNSERPAFQEMMEDVQQGKINLILVKDLSRFGRNYIEVGRYTDFILPELGCRLVAPLDNIDTGRQEIDMLPFRALLNDHYLKDISTKIKTAHRTMAMEGKRISGRPPYGYRLDTTDKHKFHIDDYAAGVVRDIFKLRLEGIGYSSIAGILNEKGILSPREYEYQSQGREWNYDRHPVWQTSSVKHVLNSESYLGHRIQLMRCSISHRNQKLVATPKEQWVRAENAHPPIIDKETWDAVQQLNQARSERWKTAKPRTPSLFRGLLRCADCGGNMHSFRQQYPRKKGGVTIRHWYQCARYAQTAMACCSNHVIMENPLIEIILKDIREHAARIRLDENKAAAKLEAATIRIPSSPGQLAKTEQRISELEHKQVQLYEDRVAGKISEQTFTTLIAECEADRLSTQQEIERLQNEQEKQKSQQDDYIIWSELIKRHANADTLDRMMLEELVERVEIGSATPQDQPREAKIIYRFAGEM